jgi:hypothetical protein
LKKRAPLLDKNGVSDTIEYLHFWGATMLVDVQVEKIKAGGLYLFVKSCNWVTAVKHIKDGFWHVRRVDTGKEMVVPERALVSNPEEYGIEVCASQDPRKATSGN